LVYIVSHIIWQIKLAKKKEESPKVEDSFFYFR